MKSILIVLFLLVTQTVSAHAVFSDSSSSSAQYVLGLNDVYETPYYVFKGKSEYPKMILDGGIHGDEIAAYMACDEIVKNIMLFQGTLIVIPKMNIQACNQNTRSVNFDFNHAFPGDLKSDIYEYRLAYEIMWLVDSIKPDLIINLHEAHTKYFPGAENDPTMAFGQVIITCIKPYEDLLMSAFGNLNEKIPQTDFKFHIHYYEFHEYSSLDNFVSKFGIKSYTIETYRGFDIRDRVKLATLASLQFMTELGIRFDYPEIKF